MDSTKLDVIDVQDDRPLLSDTEAAATKTPDCERGDPFVDDGDGGDDDVDLDGLTLYERKAALVNRDLDRQGMGRYQWCIFFLCGFGYFLDLLWAQAFGLVAVPMQREFGFSDAELGSLFASFSAGLTAGAFVWGFLVDIIGRYWAFNFTVLWSSIFGLVLGLPDSYNVVLVLTALIGFGIGGNIPIDTTICLECLPQSRRWLLPALSIFQPIGVVVCSGIAYGFIPTHSCDVDLPACSTVPDDQACCTRESNHGWRYLMYTLGAVTIIVFIGRFVFFRFQESPKYLISRGRDAEAVKSLRYIAKFNNTESKITLETLRRLSHKTDSRNTSVSNSATEILPRSDSIQANQTIRQKFKTELSRYKLFFSTPSMIRLTVLLWIIYGFDYWGFSIAGAFLPKILAEKGKSLGLSLTETYASYIYIYIFGIPGVIVGATIYNARRTSMVVSSALFGVCLFVFTAVDGRASYIGINGLVYFFQSMFNGILYGITPEFFPAPIRGTASGVASFWGRIFSIVAPIAAAHVLEKSLNGVLYMAGGGVFVCTIAILFLPSEYMGSESF